MREDGSLNVGVVLVVIVLLAGTIWAIMRSKATVDVLKAS